MPGTGFVAGRHTLWPVAYLGSRAQGVGPSCRFRAGGLGSCFGLSLEPQCQRRPEAQTSLNSEDGWNRDLCARAYFEVQRFRVQGWRFIGFRA